MRIFVLVVMLAGAGVAGAQPMTRPVPEREQVIWSTWPVAALAASSDVGGICLPASEGARLTAMSIRVTGASGGGAGDTVLTATDGTNTCTFTFPCTSAAGGTGTNPRTLRAAGVNAAGTGCTYARGACIAATVTTAGCTTTQPTLRTLAVQGMKY
jgi:hypothetical protein